jgi:class 3 adenylate cyclase
MAPLDGRARATLPDSAFAYIDSKGRRRLPINDAAHVRNALARFQQTAFEADAVRERARQRLLRAARKFGVSPLGFFDGQLQQERRIAELKARAAKAARLPRGTVTFLLADIEGSTKLTRLLGDDYPVLLQELWQQIRKTVRAVGGEEVDIRGDEYFAVFRRPLDALNGAVGIQLSMRRKQWPKGVDLRVRIGLHTGSPTISDAAYVGITVHSAARVCSAGHGGQILLSSAAQEAMVRSLPAGIRLRELGRYALAGLAQPESLFQVETAGLMLDFPRLRAKLAPRSRAPRGAVLDFGSEELPLWPSASTTPSKTRS